MKNSNLRRNFNQENKENIRREYAKLSFLNYLYLFLIAGCSEGYEVSKKMEVYGNDFTPYTEKGFLFTPEEYNGSYDAIGLIELSLYPQVTKDSSKLNNNFDTWDRGGSWGPGWYVGKISAGEVLDSLYRYTKKMGADAVTRLKIESAEPRTNGKYTINGIKASGFAIKRK